MSSMTLIIALPIFFVVYQAMELLLERRRSDRNTLWRRPTEGKRSFGYMAQQSFERVGQFGFNQWLLRNKSLKTGIDRRLMLSGNPMSWTPETLLVIKEFMTVSVLLILWKNQLDSPLYLLAGAYLGFKFPDLYLNIKIGERKTQIQQQLPGFIDLLALTMEGGMDLLAATEKIIEKMKPNALKSEFSTLLQENRLGTSRKESFQHMAERVNLSDVDSMAAMVIQSEELGTSLTNVLRNYAEDMRSRRILRAEEAAGKAPVKLLFPMMVFFFPIVFVIIFGPLALNLWSSR